MFNRDEPGSCGCSVFLNIQGIAIYVCHTTHVCMHKKQVYYSLMLLRPSVRAAGIGVEYGYSII